MKSKKVLKNGTRNYLYLSTIVLDSYFLAISDQLDLKSSQGSMPPEFP